MTQLRNKLTVGATLLSLAGLTGVAMSASGRKSDQGTAPAADIRTVTTQQTIRKYRNVGAGGASNGTWAQSGAVFAVAHGSGRGLSTHASGAKKSYGSTASGKWSAVKSGPSGAHKSTGGQHYASTGTGSNPTTHASGSKPSGGKGSAPVTTNPTTKASGSTGESTGTGTTPTTPAPPTTKPSGAPSGGETKTEGTPTTPAPPTTKPSGSTGGKTEGGETKEGKSGKGHEDN